MVSTYVSAEMANEGVEPISRKLEVVVEWDWLQEPAEFGLGMFARGTNICLLRYRPVDAKVGND